jgi:tetratricopeptide (TPR) repeat protein
MASDELNELRKKSAELAKREPLSDAALAAHSAVLARDPADRAAANRLGIALINLGRLGDAEKVLSQAVAENPDNDIAQKRLQDLPRLVQRAAEDRGLVPRREEWPEYVEYEPSEVRRLVEAGNENWRAFLTILARAAPSRLTYGQIEERLDWDRGRLRNVIGGTRSADGEASRPYHICSPAISRSGEWEAWMDLQQAAVVIPLAGTKEA